MYHSALASVEDPAEGHFSLWLGETNSGRTVAIPAAAEIYLVPIQVDWSLEAGSEARIHLHNHGGNSWRVAYIKRFRGEPPSDRSVNVSAYEGRPLPVRRLPFRAPPGPTRRSPSP